MKNLNQKVLNALFSIFLLVLFFGCKCSSQNNIDSALCNDIVISNEIWNYYSKELSNQEQYIKSELWLEYNDNRPEGTYRFPDEFYIHTYLFDAAYFLGNESKIVEPFKVVVKVQLKYSLSEICTNPINYKLTKDYLVDEEEINHETFMAMVRGDVAEKVKLVSDPFPLRNILNENKVDGANLFFNQVVVKTYLYNLNNILFCCSEYIQPICTRGFKYE
jgi:hypothetical protein